MSITITQQIPILAPAYNDIVLSVSSTNVVSKFKMKYVYDIFQKSLGTNNTTYVGRVRQTPNPSGAGMLDLARYLQLQVSQDLFSGVMFDIPQTSKLAPGYNTLVQYWVECGEEYATTLTGTVSLYNGNGTLNTSDYLTSTSTISGYTFNGVKQFSEGLYWDQTNYVKPSNRRLLTNSPRTLYKEEDEYITTACLYGTYNGTSFPISGSTYAKVYDSNNTLLKTYNPQTGFTATSGNILPLFSGVRIMDVIFQANSWDRIELQIGSSNQTEVLTIKKNVCPWRKYNPTDIIFLNRYGAWDTFRFYGSKNEEVKIQRDTYERAYGTWASSTYNYNTYERGTSNIKTDLIVEGEVMSDFIERDTVNWLGELLTSSQVYKLEAETGYLTPINIIDNNFKRQIKGNVKLRQVSFKYTYSTQERTQQQ
jgi:hypothetical protein